MEKDGIRVIDIWSSSEEDEVEERFRGSVFYFPKGKGITVKDEFKKKNKNSRAFDDEDCFILDYDPFESIKKLSINDKDNDETDDLSVIAEKGQVACRDYPHSRHLCVKFPFSKTPHNSHCEQCYCYACDSVAPCKFWSNGPQEHCHATADDPYWKLLREAGRPISSSEEIPLVQRGMNFAITEMHGYDLGCHVMPMNFPQPVMSESFDYDGQWGYPSGKHSGSYRVRGDRFTEASNCCFNCGLPGHFARECPATAAAGRGGGRFNVGPEGYCYGGRYSNDRYGNHDYAEDRGPPLFGGGDRNGNHDRYTGDRCPPAGSHSRGGDRNRKHNCYIGDRGPPAGIQYGRGERNGNQDGYAGDRCPPARGLSGNDRGRYDREAAAQGGGGADGIGIVGLPMEPARARFHEREAVAQGGGGADGFGSVGLPMGPAMARASFHKRNYRHSRSKKKL